MEKTTEFSVQTLTLTTTAPTETARLVNCCQMQLYSEQAEQFPGTYYAALCRLMLQWQ